MARKEGLAANVKDVGNFDYICDYVNFGPIEEMKKILADSLGGRIY